MRKYFLPALALVFVGLYYSCTKDKTVVAPAYNCTGVSSATNTFALNINPNIVSYYCSYATACHGPGSSNGIDMSTYSGTVDAFKNKNVICAIKNSGCELMPKANSGLPPLADSLILQMECWAQNGYPQ